MKKIFFIILVLLFIWFAAAPGLAGDMKTFATDEIKKNISFSSGSVTRKLVIDNIFGSITVSGYSGDEVIFQGRRIVKAESPGAAEKAKMEVKLEISEKDNIVTLYVNGPFRRKDGSVFWEKRRLDYIVKYDFDVKVPVRTDITLKTINDGDVRVQDLTGRFKVRNINGKIAIKNISGEGEAHTVNGEVTVAFKRHPEGDCSFKTINGDIDLSFASAPSADFRLKTFSGDILSDFEVSYLPAQPVKGTRENGMFVYKASRFQTVRIGTGGPKITIDTFNGDILLSKINS